MGSTEQPASAGSRVFVLAGGLCGAAGVALSAAAAHLGGAFVGTAASFLLMHAPVFLAVGLIGAERALRSQAWSCLSGWCFSAAIFSPATFWVRDCFQCRRRSAAPC